MNQLSFQQLNPRARFHAEPVDAPDSVVTMCKNEAEAIAHCIDLARSRFGLSQLDVALACGWKSDSFLSEIRKDRKRMPAKRMRRFALVTGCNLLEQYVERQKLLREMTGKHTDRDRSQAVVAQLLAHVQSVQPAPFVERRAAA